MASVHQRRHERNEDRGTHGTIGSRHRRRWTNGGRTSSIAIGRGGHQSHRRGRYGAAGGRGQAATGAIARRTRRQLGGRRASRGNSGGRRPIIFKMVRIVQRVAQRVNRRRMMDRINNGCRAGAYRRTTPIFNNGLFGQSFQTVLRAFTITLFRFVSVLLRHQDLFRHVTRMGPSGPWQRDSGRQGAPTPVRRILFTSGNQGWRRCTDSRRGPNGEAGIRPTTRGTAFAIEKMFHGGC